MSIDVLLLSSQSPSENNHQSFLTHTERDFGSKEDYPFPPSFCKPFLVGLLIIGLCCRLIRRLHFFLFKSLPISTVVKVRLQVSLKKNRKSKPASSSIFSPFLASFIPRFSYRTRRTTGKLISRQRTFCLKRNSGEKKEEFSWNLCFDRKDRKSGIGFFSRSLSSLFLRRSDLFPSDALSVQKEVCRVFFCTINVRFP